jgi:ParB family chromosome partitioning protein
MSLQLDDLAALDAPSPTSNGQPLLLPVADIDEDPDQPRREFDANALQDLAETIRERGVRQPISVRPNLQQAGRWALNFGARRLRASKLAGRETIPAFIDTTADSYDQVIENEQREGLKPLELALFVQKRLALGDRQADIAKNLGKSRQWVTLATALIEAPDWLLQAYREGRCRGMNELYELRRLHGEHAEVVEAWAVSSRSTYRPPAKRCRRKCTSPSPLRPSARRMVSSSWPGTACRSRALRRRPIAGRAWTRSLGGNESLHVEGAAPGAWCDGRIPAPSFDRSADPARTGGWW